MSAPLTFCPVCAHRLELRESGGRLRPVCPKCGYVHYVNPVPTVGIVIEMEGGVVLIRRGHPPHKGRWAFPSGYVEADERLEEAAIREAEEETGLKVEIIELADVNSYPEGPPASGVMVFYRARPVGGELRAGDDATEARVFRPEEAPLLPFRTHREMMAQWLARQTGAPAPRIAIATQDTPVAYNVRAMRPQDAQEVVDLAQMIPANHALTEADWRDTLLRLRELPNLNVFVAQLDATPPMLIGCVVLSTVRTLTGGYGLIDDMAVLPTYRRQGVGAALLEAAMRCAGELNLHTLLVGAHRTSAAAQSFFARAGFVAEPVMQLRLR